MAQLHAALDRPEGFASYGAVQQWIADTLGVPMGYHAVYKLVRRKLRTKLKVPRPQHEKNDQVVAQFQAEFPALVQAAVAPDEPRPVVVWAFDQSRFGLRTIQRRRITSCGVKPRGICQYGYQNFWLYGAVAPATGDAFFYVLPMLNAEYMQLFLNALAEARPDTLNVLLLDNSRAHRAQTLVMPSNVVLLFQPAYAPEVNPSERVWEDLKTDLAWERYPSLPALQDHIVRLVEAYDAPTLHSLTAYPYFMNAVNALSP